MSAARATAVAAASRRTDALTERLQQRGDGAVTPQDAADERALVNTPAHM
jgi:hypothetical protein